MAGKPGQGRESGEFAEPGPGARGEQCDAELIVQARAGDEAAFGVLYKRHVASARRLAGLYASTPADAEDIASEGFTQVLSAVRAGGGPREAFRPYVLTTVRRIAARRAARAKRDVPTPELESVAPLVPFEDPVLADLEVSLVARAFAALPERWQAVLWHTTVEGESPAQVAVHLGLSANGVAALAVRAREGLRKEYLQAHLSAEKLERECRRCASKLAAYVRGSLSARARGGVEAHLAECDRCTSLLPELREISGRLRGIVAPLLLGPLFAGYLTSPADGSPDAAADGREPTGSNDGTGLGKGVAGGRASSQAAVALTSLAAVVVALAVAGTLLLPEDSPSRLRTAGRAPVTGPGSPPPPPPTSASPGPAPSRPTPPLRGESPPGGRSVGPGSDPTAGRPTDRVTEPPSDGPSDGPSPTPSDRPVPVPVPDPRLSGGAFESPSVGEAPNVRYGNGQFIGGWRVENSVSLTGRKEWQPASGTQALDLNGDPPAANGAISQSFATQPGQQYAVSFFLAGNPMHGAAVMSLTVQVAGVSKDFSFDTTGHSSAAMGWRPETVRFTATADRTTLRLASTSDPSSPCGPAVDDVKVMARRPGH
ncbi:choice-of-anchor C family protein [Streptomyces sioyaensis]|uniref:choice-of-anchor C family protein n=1 Tax=Streptomyces sioyaensis TaxID=67364 RepID=UPI0033F21885